MPQAQAQASQPRVSRNLQLPGENLTLQETLRVMDVAREMRERRETAEEIFQWPVKGFEGQSRGASISK